MLCEMMSAALGLGTMPANELQIDRGDFEDLAVAYCRKWPVELLAAEKLGRVVFGQLSCRCDRRKTCRDLRSKAIYESLRWGESAVVACPGAQLIWAVPVVRNQQLLGGILAVGPEEAILGRPGRPGPIDVRRATWDLREAVEDRNWTNQALLQSRREAYHREQSRAEAIQVGKVGALSTVAELYVREEPALLAAIRKGNRADAREILNRILAAMYFRAGTRVELIKSFLMELVVMMSRAAVEAGARAEDLLGVHYTSISALAGLDSQPQLAKWLRGMLEHVMDAIHSGGPRPPAQVAAEALRFMRDHLDARLSRRDVAEAVGLSEWHFSRVFHQAVGRSYAATLRRLRVDRAAERIVRSDAPLAALALECGFADQSHLTKVFRRLTGQTPGQYRRSRGRSIDRTK